MTQYNNHKRIFLIDQIRGFTLIIMILYHAFYDIIFIFNLDRNFLFLPFINIIPDIIGGTFIFISGFSCQLSKNNFKRGFITLFLGISITAVTYVFIPQQVITFGILHFLGFSMIIYSILKKFVNRINFFIAFPILIFLFISTYNISSGLIGIENFFSFKVPLYLSENPFLFPFGFISNTFSSSDYYPVFPWIFIFFFGAHFAKQMLSKTVPKFMYKRPLPILSKISSYSIVIYIIHQPILFGFFYLLKGIING
ncbi:MAG: DUF1624 domain-containing protein [Oscillospiraceae bacterium]|nr:DUF1624 domain-containing protein [Oscillospiraceae bacterium]